MQNNDVLGMGRPKEWSAKKHWVITLLVVVGLVIGVAIVADLLQPQIVPPLTFDPLTGVTVIDSLGNNDGQINPGERVKIRLRLNNLGTQPISGFDMVLSTNDTEVGLIDSTLHYSAIGAGDTLWSQDAFEFKLDSTFRSECVVFTGTLKNVTLARLGGGLVAEAFANPMTSGNTISFALDVYSLYRLCFGDCQMLKGAGATDSLVINVSVCNRATSALTAVSVQIKSVGACSRPDLGFFTPLSKEFSYGDVGRNNCRPPFDSSVRFAFAPPAGLPVNVGSFICVHFVVTIKSNNATVIELNEGIDAKVESAT